jgi:prevent-host-death family protein
MVVAVIATTGEDRVMLKTISAMKLRQNLGQVMNEVALRGDDYIVERAGKPLVAIIPMEKYRKLQQDLDAFFGDVKAFQNSVENVDPSELEEAIQDAVAAAKLVTAERLKAESKQ